MRLIAGLGNPGTEYALTRHNVGWDVIDRLADRLGALSPSTGFGGLFRGPLNVGGERCLLLKPTTYMNESGVAVGALARFYKVVPADTLIVVDDINLPVGRMRFRPRGSAGGHNGLKSVIAHLGTQDFPRLRVGVGACPPRYDMAAWVLGRFSDRDRGVVDELIDEASAFCEFWCGEKNFDKLMNRVNAYSAKSLNGEA